MPEPTTPEPQPFPTLADVLDYLKSAGWRVTRTSLYRHQGEGKIRPGDDGEYHVKDVDRYAKTWLKRKETGRRAKDALESLQTQKLEKENRRLDLENEIKEMERDKKRGMLIARELIELELAGRAGVLEAGLRHWIQSKAFNWVRIVDGDPHKVADLISLMLSDLDEHLNSYAAPIDYTLIIGADEERNEYLES